MWDFSGLGGVNSRIEVKQAERRINYWQRMLTRIIRRIRNVVLADGISQGLIPPHPNWKAFDAHFGAWIITDTGYETESNLELVKMGVMPAADLSMMLNKDNGEVARKNASTILDFKEVAGETAVPIEMLAGVSQPHIYAQKLPLSALQTAGYRESLLHVHSSPLAERLTEITDIRKRF